jgi:hypothetical protein
MQNLDFAIHDFIEIKSCRKANHIFNTSIKPIHKIKMTALRKSYAIVFMY